MLEERKGDPNREKNRWRGKRSDLATQGKQLERPMQSVCPLEIRSAVHEPEQAADSKRREPTRGKGQAAVDTASRIKGTVSRVALHDFLPLRSRSTHAVISRHDRHGFVGYL